MDSLPVSITPIPQDMSSAAADLTSPGTAQVDGLSFAVLLTLQTPALEDEINTLAEKDPASATDRPPDLAPFLVPLLAPEPAIKSFGAMSAAELQGLPVGQRSANAMRSIDHLLEGPFQASCDPGEDIPLTANTSQLAQGNSSQLAPASRFELETLAEAANAPPATAVNEATIVASAAGARSEPAQETSPAGEPAAMQLGARVGTAEWSEEFGQKITWLANEHETIAELRLNPPDLGPIEIVLTVEEDGVSAAFVAAQSAVREAIDSALPKLKDMLADAGVRLHGATVSAEHSGRDASGERPARHSAPIVQAFTNAEDAPAARAGRAGMIDVFV